MFFSSLKNAARPRLATKLILTIIVLLCAVSIILTFFFIQRQKKLLTEELHKRVRSLAQNLAYDSINYLAPINTYTLQNFVSGVIKERDIKNVLIVDSRDSVLVSSDSQYHGKIINFSVDSLSYGKKSAEKTGIMRVIIPIDENIPIIKRDNKLIPYTRKFQDGWYSFTFKSGGYFFPNFRTNNEITFSAVFHGALSGLAICGTFLENPVLELLIDSSTNGFWSRSGRYFTFFFGDTGTHSVYDTVTGNVTSLYPKGVLGKPCFTPDEQYIINTMPTEKGEERLYRIPREGGNPVQLTFHEGRHWFPSCSPDGKWIMYTDYIAMKLYVYNTKTKKSSLIFPNLKDKQWCSSISPDGGKFCYLRLMIGGFELYITNFDSNKNPPINPDDYGIRLTTDGGHKWYTDWSPDGNMIAYAIGEGNGRPHEIDIISSKGGAQTHITGMLQSERKRLGYVVLDASLENLQNAVAEGKYIAILITLIMIGIGSISAIVLVRNIVRPVGQLADAVSEVGKGDFDQKIPVSRHDEIGILAESFNRMTERLQISREEIITRNRELEKAYKPD